MSEINWTPHTTDPPFGAWVDGVHLTDTGMSVLGTLSIRPRYGIHEIAVEMHIRVGYKGTPYEDRNRNPAAATVVEALKAQEAALIPGSFNPLLDQYKKAHPDENFVKMQDLLEWAESAVLFTKTKKEEPATPPAVKDVEGQTNFLECQPEIDWKDEKPE